MATSITLSDDYAEKLETIADRHQRSMAAQVRYWVDLKEEVENMVDALRSIGDGEGKSVQELKQEYDFDDSKEED